MLKSHAVWLPASLLSCGLLTEHPPGRDPLWICWLNLYFMQSKSYCIPLIASPCAMLSWQRMFRYLDNRLFKHCFLHSCNYSQILPFRTRYSGCWSPACVLSPSAYSCHCPGKLSAAGGAERQLWNFAQLFLVGGKKTALPTLLNLCQCINKSKDKRWPLANSGTLEWT